MLIPSSYKRDDYQFGIVRLPYVSSNIPKKMFISSIVAEILRIARVTSTIQSFLKSVQTLVRRMKTQGAYIPDVKISTHKNIIKHWEDFQKYSLTSKVLTSSIFT